MIVSKRTVGLATLVLASMGAFGIGTVLSPDESLRNAPEVQRFAVASTSRQDAERAWLHILESDRENYVSQSRQADYSVSQAHSQVEKAYQELQLSESVVHQEMNSPLVRDYFHRENLSFGCYALATVLLLGAGALWRKRKDES